MRLVLVAVALSCLLAAAVAQEASYGADSNVVVLTDADFDEKMATLPKVVLVEFYAPWCGHCKQLKPQYEEAANTLKQNGIDAALVAVDAEANSKLAQTYKIEGFPTLKIFKNGKEAGSYDGERSAEAIVAHLEGLLLPAVQEISSTEALESFKSKTAVAVVGRFSPENAVAQKSFDEACQKIKDEGSLSTLRCARIVDQATAKAANMPSAPHLHVFRKFEEPDEEPTIEFDFFTEEGFNTEKITSWIKTAAFPILAEITPRNFPQYEARNLPIVWVFLNAHGSTNVNEEEEAAKNTPEQEEHAKQTKSLVRSTVGAFADRLSFVYLSGIDFADHAEALGVDTKNLPAVVVMPITGNAKYVMNSSIAFTSTSLKQFIQDYLDGKLVPTVRSEPEPATNDGPVKIVVAKTLDQLVWDNDNDVFIEFYAPWCGHCKKVAPIWEELARSLSKVKGLTIAKIDATANDVPEEVQGFPMFYFKKATQKDKKINKDMLFEGDRTKKGFLSFLKKHATVDLGDMEADVERVKKFLDELPEVLDEMKRMVKEHEAMSKASGKTTQAAADAADEAEDADDIDFAQFAEQAGLNLDDHDGHDHDHDHDHDHEEL